MKNIKLLLPALLLILVIITSCEQKEDESFHFYVATDVHMIKQRVDYTNWFFRDNILSDIKNDSVGIGEFIVVTGDMDPFFRVRKSVEQVLGNDYRFYPVVGNHDVGYTNNDYKIFPDSNWSNAFDMVNYNKRNIKKVVNWGPSYSSDALNNLVYMDSLSGKENISTYDSLEVIGSKYTTYSFDKGNSHFVVLDIYSGLKFKGAEHKGRISNELYNWLAADLTKTNKENIFVFAHQPLWNVRNKQDLVNASYESFIRDLSHDQGADSLAWFKKEYTSKIKSRDEIWNLMKKHKVVAYFCGHTHHYSANKYDGVWEINLEFGAWEIEGRSRYGKVIVNELLVQGFIKKTASFETIDRVLLRD